MPSKCEICGIGPLCKQVKDEKIMFHTFPIRRPDMLAKWLEIIGKPRLETLTTTQLKSKYVCSRHFRPSCYPGPHSRFLYENALPAIEIVCNEESQPAGPLEECGNPSSPDDFGDRSSSPEAPSSPLCRLCGQEKEGCVSIFSEEQRQNHLQQKIQECLPLRVNEDDGLPQTVCSSCVSKVETYHNFIASCCQSVVNILSSLGTDPVWFENKYFSRSVQLDHNESNKEGSESGEDCREPLRSVVANNESDSKRRTASHNVTFSGNSQSRDTRQGDDNMEETRYHKSISTSCDELSDASSDQEENCSSKIRMKSLHSDYPKNSGSEVFVCMLCYKKVHGLEYPFKRYGKYLRSRQDEQSVDNALSSGEVSGQLRTLMNLNQTLKKGPPSNECLPPKCRFCPKLFLSKLHRIQHQLSHPQARLFICDSGSQSYPQKKRSVYYCDVCGETMRHICKQSKELTKRHGLPRRGFACEGCGKRFSNRLRF